MKLRSETGEQRARRVGNGGRGFTLLEVLITIALIGLLTSVLIVGSTRVISDQPATPEDIFRKAVGETRKYAVENNAEVRLSYDSKEKVFNASTADSARHYPVTAPGDFSIDFLSSQKGGSAVMIAGMIVETQPLAYITFYADGTCSSFRVQFRTPTSARVIAIDPWTCAPMLESQKQP